MFKATFNSVHPLFVAAVLGTFVFSACGGDETVSSGAAGYDSSINALTGPGGMLLTPKELKGTYGASCKVNHGATWDLKLNDAADNSLTVALNDTFANCPLTLTTIRVQEGTQTTLVDYSVVPPIILGNGYTAGASMVKAGTNTAFYTNAKLGGLAATTYANNFRIDMIYSDDALACGNIAPPAIYAQVTATANGSSVPPPNYAMTFDSLALVVDANKVVQPSSSGNIVLTPPATGAQPGEEYKIFETFTCCGSFSFADIDELYRTGTPVAGGTGTILGSGAVNIPWTSFALAGKTLRQDRYIIVKHMGAGGVYSYELLDVAFPGPRP